MGSRCRSSSSAVTQLRQPAWKVQSQDLRAAAVGRPGERPASRSLFDSLCASGSLEAAAGSVCSHPGDGPRAGCPVTLSSCFTKPTGLYVAHRFLRGELWGTKTLRFLGMLLPLPVGSAFPLLLEPCTRGDPGSTAAGAGGSRSQPRASSRESRRTALGSE